MFNFKNSMLEVKNLFKTFEISPGFFQTKIGVRALNNISFNLTKTKTLGILGESGSGKSTLAKIICGLIEKDSGEVLIDGKSVESLTRKELSSKVQMIFQDPYDSLNPKLTVGVHILEALNASSRIGQNTQSVEDILSLTGLSAEFTDRFPHQLSGGQRQRVAIARVLATKPEIIIADEPVSALDVSIQTQILNLFKELRERLSITFIFISHDILATAYLSDELIIMKDGEIIESGSTESLIKEQKNEYTKKLIGSFRVLV